MAECAKFPDLTSDEIEKIIEDATLLNTKRATAWGVSVLIATSYPGSLLYALFLERERREESLGTRLF